MTDKDVLASVNDHLRNQGVNPEYSTAGRPQMETLLNSLKAARDTQSALYSWNPPHGKDNLRQVKNTLLQKIKNIIVNVLEKTVMRQQKYNELLYLSVEELNRQVSDLKAQLETNSSNDPK